MLGILSAWVFLAALWSYGIYVGAQDDDYSPGRLVDIWFIVKLNGVSVIFVTIVTRILESESANRKKATLGKIIY